MRIGVAADSGGDVGALSTALALLQGPLACDRVFFLGGHYVDVDGYLERAAQAAPPPADNGGLLDAMAAALMSLSPVPLEGPARHVVRVCEREGPDGADRKVFDMLGTQLCLLVHNKADLTKDDIANAPVILHGKSKAPAMVKIGSRTFITPGSVASLETPTVAILEPQGSALTVAFFSLAGQELQRETVTMGGPTKFSAR